MAVFPEYDQYDAVGLAELIAGQEISAREVLEAAIGRVEALNPAVNAVIHPMFDHAEAALADGLPDGPLAGVPYLLKDLYILCRGAPTRNGSRFFADHVADHDSTLTERLKAAGLVILGKTNTPEFGISAATEPVAHGPTRNPWDPARSAGGSSGGAAVAVASGMVPAAHATDGGGSIRIPASCCGLFGLKLTRARNPAGPDIGEGWSGLASGHAVTRTVRDSAALLDVTHGPATGDPYHPPPPARPFLEEVGADPGRLRIAVTTDLDPRAEIDPVCVAAVEDAARLCEGLGHTVEDAAPSYDAAAMRWAFHIIVGGNLHNALALREQAVGRERRDGDVERITDIWADEGASASAGDYARAIQVVHAIGRSFGRFFERYDILLSPTLAGPPVPLGSFDMMGDDLSRYNEVLMAHIPFTPPFNAAGCPAMSVPLAWSEDGLPVGVQFGAGFGHEAVLFRLAAQLEAARPWRDRRPPVAGG
ncbi:MAG: amidase [Alphaproteobacteria bacterium]|nr:amidase [Alphaproteobacteria bacterium]